MLNPHAAPFEPKAAQASSQQPSYDYYYYDPLEDDDGPLTSEDLEELEAVEDWVEQMAELAESEREHLISLALSQAAPEEIAAVELKHI